MAIQLNAQRGGFSINGGYLLVTHARVDKYLRPVTVQKQVTQDDGTIITVDEPGMVNAVMTVARIQVYPTREMREEEFGVTQMQEVFSFEHVNGRDPVDEAYEHVKLHGLRGWLLSQMVDV